MGWSSTCGLCFCFYRLFPEIPVSPARPGPHKLLSFSDWEMTRSCQNRAVRLGKGSAIALDTLLGLELGSNLLHVYPELTMTEQTNPINFHLFCGKTISSGHFGIWGGKIPVTSFNFIAIWRCRRRTLLLNMRWILGRPCLMDYWISWVMIRSLTRRTSKKVELQKTLW